MKHIWICLAAGALSACRADPEARRPGQPTVRQPVVEQQAVQQQATVDVGRADSARAFVQGFYDWYLATEANKGSSYDSLLTGRRGFLGDSLFRALQADIAFQRADTVAEIASVSADYDVFLNSQDPCDRYEARQPRAAGGDTLAVVVAGTCEGLDTRPNIEVYLRPTASGWRIEDLKDPTDPSYDLLRTFALNRAEQATPVAPDSMPHDSSRHGTA